MSCEKKLSYLRCETEEIIAQICKQIHKMPSGVLADPKVVQETIVEGHQCNPSINSCDGTIRKYDVYQTRNAQNLNVLNEKLLRMQV